MLAITKMHISILKYRPAGYIYFIHYSISDSGSVDISLTSSLLDVSVMLGRGSSDHMTLKATNCSVKIGHLSVHFHGGARYVYFNLLADCILWTYSWLYNLFDDQIEDSLESSLSKSLCGTAMKYIDTGGNAAVESIPGKNQ